MVKDIPSTASETELREMFGAFGVIADLKLRKDRFTPVWIAFIVYESEESVEKVLAAEHKLTVGEESKEKTIKLRVLRLNGKGKGKGKGIRRSSECWSSKSSLSTGNSTTGLCRSSTSATDGTLKEAAANEGAAEEAFTPEQAKQEKLRLKRQEVRHRRAAKKRAAAQGAASLQRPITPGIRKHSKQSSRSSSFSKAPPSETDSTAPTRCSSESPEAERKSMPIIADTMLQAVSKPRLTPRTPPLTPPGAQRTTGMCALFSAAPSPAPAPATLPGILPPPPPPMSPAPPLPQEEKIGRLLAQKEAHHDGDANDPRKIFIGGLHYAVNDEVLLSYFGMFGNIINCRVKLHPSGHSRGYGFVTFSDCQSVARVMTHGKRHELRGRECEAMPKGPFQAQVSPQDWAQAEADVEQIRAATAYNMPFEVNMQLLRNRTQVNKHTPDDFLSVYAMGLPSDANEQTVREHFEIFGLVTNIISPQQSGIEGAWFVTFDCEEAVASVLEFGQHYMDEWKGPMKTQKPIRVGHGSNAEQAKHEWINNMKLPPTTQQGKAAVKGSGKRHSSGDVRNMQNLNQAVNNNAPRWGKGSGKGMGGKGRDGQGKGFGKGCGRPFGKGSSKGVDGPGRPLAPLAQHAMF